jgi:hypothetical protein
MTDVVKLVNRAIPTSQRNQTFTDADAGTGDVILVQDSLGKPASHLVIEAGSPMTFRLNVYHTVYPQRGLADGMADMQILGPNVSRGITIKDATQDPITLDALGTFTLDNDLPIVDIELVTVSGVYELFVT